MSSPAETASPAAPRVERTTGVAASAAPPVRKAKLKVGKYVPWFIGAALFALVAMGLAPKPLPVELGTATMGPMQVSVLEEGKTRIRHRYVISPPVGGYLQRVPLRAGAKIVAGETVLAEILPEPASLLNPRLQSEAEARVKGAAAALQQREQDLERAKAAKTLANRELERATPLRKSGAISTREFDQAEMDSSMRERETRSAEFAIQVARFELQQAEAALLQAQGGAPAAAEPFTIKAPVSGFVLNVFEESARIVAPGTRIMEVGDVADLEAEIELLSTDAAGVARGAPALIERWGGDKPLPARVSLVEPAAFTKVSALGVEEQRVLVRVQFEGALPTEPQPLGDRYRVEARIQVWSAERVLRVPTGALFRRGSDWMCFTLQGGRATLRKLKIGHNNGVDAEVRGGLSEGEAVILHPPEAIAEGTRVAARE